MDTKEIQNFYNDSLSKSREKKYEYRRWGETSQGRASFKATYFFVKKYVIPLLKNNDYVFELGPGPGTWTKLLSGHAISAKFDLVDISEEMLAQAKDNLQNLKNINFLHSDILDFKTSAKYDFFFSSRMIEYVPDKKQAVENIINVMKVGAYGVLITKTPQYNRPFSKRIHSRVHQNQISPEELSLILTNAGCEVKKVINVTSVFPGLRSGYADLALTKLCGFLPFGFSRIVSESYALIFQKK